MRIIDDFSSSPIDPISYEHVEYSSWSDYEEVDAQVVELVNGSVCDLELLREAFYGVEVIVHLAANTGINPSIARPHEDFMINCLGTFNCLEAARDVEGLRRFVFASTGAVLGGATAPFREELRPHPLSPYGASKLAGEGYCIAFNEAFAVPTAVLRFSNVYGPYSSNKNSLIAKVIKNVLLNQTIEVFGEGSQTRDFIYVDDIISAIIGVVDNQDANGELFHIGTGFETSVAEVVDLVCGLMAKRGYVTPDVVHRKKLETDAQINYTNPTKAKDLLSWSAQTSLTRGVERTIDYMISALSEKDDEQVVRK